MKNHRFLCNQAHAALIRGLITQKVKHSDPDFCVRVTANDGAEGEHHLETLQQNSRTIPTILTTSQKLSTGVDAKNVRNIVLMRPISSMIKFKQIIGRGTRTFEGKDYFTVYDFVKAHEKFDDPQWDGDPADIIIPPPCTPRPSKGDDDQTGNMAENSDIFDVLALVAYAVDPLTREERASTGSAAINANYNDKLATFCSLYWVSMFRLVRKNKTGQSGPIT